MNEFSVVLFLIVSIFAFDAVCMDPFDLDLPPPPAVGFPNLVEKEGGGLGIARAVERKTVPMLILNFHSRQMLNLANASPCPK